MVKLFIYLHDNDGNTASLTEEDMVHILLETHSAVARNLQFRRLYIPDY